MNIKAELAQIAHDSRATGYSMAITDIVKWCTEQLIREDTQLINSADLIKYIQSLQDGRDARVTV